MSSSTGVHHPPTPIITSEEALTPIIINDHDDAGAGADGLVISVNGEGGGSDGFPSTTTTMMMTSQQQSLLSRVLLHRQLHYADQLFSVSDYDVLIELHTALAHIKHILNDPAYVRDSNDQSVVELVLARISAAIRATSSIETYAPALVDLIEACLSHQMYVIGADNRLEDSPHCKIASELLSTLFMYHSRKSVMLMAIPVAASALGSMNQELVRNTTSYLSLAAIRNGRVLSQFAVQIISSILNGNYALIRVVPQLYPENREPFHAHLSPLFRLLHYTATDLSLKLCLLQLASMVANTKPDLIVPHLAEFEEFLMQGATSTAVLHILLSLISMGRVSCLTDQLLPLRRACRNTPPPTQNNIASMGKIIGVIGKTSEHMAVAAAADLCLLSRACNAQNLPILLKEVEGIAELFPSAVRPQLELIRELIPDHQPSTYASYSRIKALAGFGGGEGHHQPMAAVPAPYIDSAESLQRSLNTFPSDPIPAPPSHPAQQQQQQQQWHYDSNIGELDHAMKTLAETYRLRSNGSLGAANPRSRSFLSLSNNNQQGWDEYWEGHN